MTAASTTPTPGIRLKGDAPIPPAPAWGVYRRATLHARHAGGVVEVTPGHHIPVCVGCYRALPATTSYGQGKRALRDHWTQEHTERAA